MVCTRNYNLSHSFGDIVSAHGNNSAICISDKCHSYIEIDEISTKIANWLDNQGVRCGDVIALPADKTFLIYSIVGSCLKLGVTYSFYESSFPIYRLEKQFNVLDPQLIIYSKDEIINNFREGFDLIELSQIEAELNRFSSKLNFNRNLVTDSSIAYVMFTSGSTGEPKGVAISHKNLINFIDWIRHDLGICVDDRITGLNKLFFDNSVFDIYASLFTGACLYPVNDNIINDSGMLFDYIRGNQITVWFSVPSLIVYHLTLAPKQSKSFRVLKKIIFGGEGFPKNSLLKLRNITDGNSKLLNVYGPTECTCICSLYEIRSTDFDDVNSDKIAPLGYINNNTDYIIVNNDGNRCGPGETGELYLGGSLVGRGYWNNIDLTNIQFIQNPFHSKYRDIYYKTGDLVCSNDDNIIEFISRSDYQIKHMGYRIELPEIENVLLTHSEISEACAVYKKTNDLGVISILYAGKIQEEYVRSYLVERIPSYMLPKNIVKLDSLPKNSNGKIDRRQLYEV